MVKVNVVITAQTVLNKIMELVRKSNKVKAIGIDTLALIFNLSDADILTLIDQLEKTGNVQRQLLRTVARRKG